MKKLIIGCDADGVLTDMLKFNIENGRKFFKREPINPSGYDLKEIFGCSKFEEILFGLIYFPKYCKKYKERENCKLIIEKYSRNGHKWYEITARKFATDNNILGKYSRNAFENWTKERNMNFQDYIYCSEKNSPLDKLIACNKLSVDVMIEDKPDVALFLAENGIKVLLFSTPYNENINHENITRVNNWQEIDYNIEKLSNLKEENHNFKVLSGEERKKLTPLELNTYIKNYKEYLLNKEFNKEINKKIDFKFKLLHKIGMLLMIFNPVKVIGKDNIPYQKGLIFASNHLDSYDQFYISKALGNRPLRGLASSTIKNTFRGKLFESTGIKFVDRENNISKKNAEEMLCVDLINNNDILIFPEGTRKNKTEEGKRKKIQDFKLGTVSISQKTGSAIVPIAINYEKKFKLFRTTIVSFGSPIIVQPTSDIIKTNELLKDNIVSMIEENNKMLVKKIS